jgi:5-methylcytosine-specific restriction endonuclease McrA
MIFGVLVNTSANNQTENKSDGPSGHTLTGASDRLANAEPRRSIMPKKFTAAQTQYYEKLKDPRWQKRRLEIFTRDDFMCLFCGATDKTLTVHHQYYIAGKEPWDYPDRALTTLCYECHDTERENLKETTSDLLSVLKQEWAFTSENFYDLTAAFIAADRDIHPMQISDIIKYVCSHKQVYKPILKAMYKPKVTK